MSYIVSIVLILTYIGIYSVTMFSPTPCNNYMAIMEGRFSMYKWWKINSSVSWPVHTKCWPWTLNTDILCLPGEAFLSVTYLAENHGEDLEKAKKLEEGFMAVLRKTNVSHAAFHAICVKQCEAIRSAGTMVPLIFTLQAGPFSISSQ